MIQLTSDYHRSSYETRVYVLIANPGGSDVDVKIPISIEDVNVVFTSTLIVTLSGSLTA